MQTPIKKNILLITSLILVGTIACLTFIFLQQGSQMTEIEAVSTVKQIYPELSDYPSDNLPPRSITTEESKDGWYLAFIQNGSGRPIISARCFYVQEDEVVWEKKFEPGVEDEGIVILPQTCTTADPNSANINILSDNKQEICEIENCHGLEIVCGANPPDFCTELYALGDKCRGYASCGVVDGECGFIGSSAFVECKSCVESCLETNPDDPEKQFLCESQC